MAFLERWKKRLPREKTQEELDEYYAKMEETPLEKGDRLAMFLGALMAFWPLILIVAAIFLIPMLIFRVF